MHVLLHAALQLKEAPKAAYLAELFKSALRDVVGLDEECDIGPRFVAMGSDGASVMTGEHNGLISQLRNTIAPFLIAVHCAAHRVNLAAAVVTQVALVGQVIAMLNSTFNLFSRSSKRANEYKQLVAENQLVPVVGGRGNSGPKLPLRIVPTRWMSTFHPLMRFLSIFPALICYVYSLRTEAMEVYNTLLDPTFVLAAAALVPLLKILHDLTQVCQQREIFVGDLMNSVGRAMNSIKISYNLEDTSARHVPFSAGIAPQYSRMVEDLPVITEGRQLPANAGCYAWWEATPDDYNSRRLKVVASTTDGRFYDFAAEGFPQPSTERQRRSELDPTMFNTVSNYVQEQITEAARLVQQDLSVRFPPLSTLKAFQLVYPSFWLKVEQPTAFGILTTLLKDIGEQFGSPVQMSGGTSVAAPLDFDQLQMEALVFLEEMLSFAHKAAADAADEMEVLAVGSKSDSEDDEEDDTGAWLAKLSKPAGDSQTTLAQRFWAHVTDTPSLAAAMSEWVRLAQLVFVMVPGSVEEERMFSSMKYLRNAQRNRLKEPHLTACARLFHHPWITLKSFPYDAAIDAWLDAPSRGRYNV